MLHRTIWTGDNLDVLRGLDEASADLVYLDPPFNSGRDYSAPVGSEAAGAAFRDSWTLTDLDVAEVGLLADVEPALAGYIRAAGQVHGDSMMSYLVMMAVRLLELRRVLAPDGSIWLHCDPTAGAYLRILMDSVFGPRWHRNEVVWCYAPAGQAPKRSLHRKHDVIHYYGPRDGTWHAPYGPMTEATRKRHSARTDDDGRRYGLIHGKRLYLDEAKGRPIPSWWADIPSFGTASASAERVGYPTQKPLALLERIIGCATDPGDLVLDPFAGCATACVAAERLGRRWAGIDISPMAAELVRRRLHDEIGLASALVDHRTDIPRRSGAEDLPPYRTAKRTLYGAQAGYCNGCGCHYEYRNLEVDHIVPRSMGGDDRPDNLQLLCGSCNRIKGRRPMSYLVARLAETDRRRGAT